MRYRSADAGPVVTIISDETTIAEAVAAWRAAADAHTSRAEAAALALADHAPVAAADTAARDAEQEAAALNEHLDNEERQLRDLTSATTEAAAALIADLLRWTRAPTPRWHTRLYPRRALAVPSVRMAGTPPT